jgi:hypothetical protein
MYDIIGDIHGHAQLLKKLLLQWGYQKTSEGYFHPARKAVFVGDFINRGPQIRKTIRMIRKMVENGNALAIAGNHEMNAIVYHLKDKNGELLVKPNRRNDLALFKTLGEFSKYREEWLDHLKWFRTLPLFLELDGIRVVHACWAAPAIEFIRKEFPAGKIKKSVFRQLLKNPKSELSQSISTITRGIDFRMPGDLKIISNKGIAPRTFRLRWWESPEGKTFEEMSFESKFLLPSYSIPKEIIPQSFIYPEDAPILFFGHYCRFHGPHIIKSNLCCLDSCVGGSKILTGYRWEGEKELIDNHLVQVGY